LPPDIVISFVVEGGREWERELGVDSNEKELEKKKKKSGTCGWQ
jgi:hypothetical protein